MLKLQNRCLSVPKLHVSARPSHQHQQPLNPATMRAFMDMCLCGSSASNAGKRGVAAKATAGPGGKTPQSAFRLPTGCTLVIRQGDLTQSDTDAIVNAANERMLGGGGVDGAIHRTAGPRLLQACEAVPEVSPGVRCPTGQARITGGFNLKARHVIHTVGPVYKGAQASAPLLASAYRSSLQLALQHGLRSVAFPAISTGVYGYPAGEAAQVSLQSVYDTLQQAAAGEGAASPDQVEVEVKDAEAGDGKGPAAAEASAGAKRVRGAQSADVSVREVHFVLFGQALYDAYVSAAKGMKLQEAGEAAGAGKQEL